MRLNSATAIAAIVLGLSAPAAFAQQADRYTMEKTPDGYVRLDTQTGAMSICRENGAQLVCQLAADDRDALEDEVMRLEDRLAALEKRVEAVEGKGTAFSLPTQEEMDKTVSFMQRFFQGFIGVVKELERDMRDPGPGPAPDRT